jgi:hypothetical protein
VVPEAPFESTATGSVPAGEGWFVLNACDARWHDGALGAFTPFQGEERFPQLGINIAVLQPGQPSCMYHRENAQEDHRARGVCALPQGRGDRVPRRLVAGLVSRR